ncbi:MAG: Do family serine endopeptidase [Hyphomicrobiaceae bacterium]|nr:Do family serine endopeptidase [Hyphomicrobiaceae bacterium]
MQIAPLKGASAKPAPIGGTIHHAKRAARVLALAGLLGAGVLAFQSLNGTAPVQAQLKPSDPGIQTPYGRAPLTFADIVDKVKGAVVSISVTNGEKSAENKSPPGRRFGGLPDLPDDHPLKDFFKNLPKEFQEPSRPSRPQLAQGSGFVISADGYVVTNNHVVDGSNKIEVSFDDQEKLEAELVGTDARTDLALIKIKSTANKSFQHVNFTERPARVGDWVIAVGNPFGLGGTVTAGIVSALTRDIGSGPYDFLQIDAAVNRGNSGGPTFNLDGEVIGVNTAIFSPSGGNVGIAFAVPAKTAKNVIEQLKNQGKVSRGWLGVKIQNVDEDTALSLGLDRARGALISEITPAGPAESSGLQPRDIVLAVNESAIDDSRDLARKIAAFTPDTVVDVKVWRNAAEKLVKVKLGTFPNSAEELSRLEQGKAAPETATDLDQLGLKLAPSGADGVKDGVAIAEVDPASDAAQKGLKAGDVILEVQGEVVKSVDDVVAGVKKARDLGRRAVLLHVRTGEQKRFVALQLKKG